MYASGELAEVWFDGGYPPGTEDLIPALLQQLQPNAVAFQGLEHVSSCLNSDFRTDQVLATM